MFLLGFQENIKIQNPKLLKSTPKIIFNYGFSVVFRFGGHWLGQDLSIKLLTFAPLKTFTIKAL